MRKEFFQEDTVTQIVRNKSLVEKPTHEVNNDEYIVFPSVSGLLIPRGYEHDRKFMKHGPEVKPKRYYSLEQAVKDGRTPVQLRERAFNSLPHYYFCGYSFLPIGRDRRKRKVSLVECLEKDRIFAYAHQQTKTGIKIRAYDDSKRVRIDGAEILCEVPSREKGAPRIQLKLTSVAVVDSLEKHIISLGIGSDHSCGVKRFNIRYRYTEDKEGSGIFNMCAHEMAAYSAVIDYYLNVRKNLIPLQMSQFAISTQKTVDYYLKLLNNVLVRDESLKTKHKLRKLHRGEKEIFLWKFVKEFGHDETFYARGSRDGNVADYKWNQ